MRAPALLAACGLALVATPAACQSWPLDSLARIGADSYFESALTSMGCVRLRVPPAAAPASWAAAIRAQAAPVMSTILGPISPAPAGDRLSLHVLVQQAGYTFSELLYRSRTVTAGQSIAWVLSPSRPIGRKPLAIVLHSTGTLPQNVFGIHLNNEGNLVTRNDSSSVVGIGLALARAGFLVMAPLLGTEPAPDRGLPWGPSEVIGSNLRKTLGSGGPETYLVSEIQAAIDYALGRNDVRGDQVFLVGENEGAYLAALTAAVDPRVRGVVRLDSPLDYRAFRLSKAGLHNDAAFAHADCTLGDVAQAVLLNGLPLQYSSTDASNEEVLRKPFRSTAVEDSLKLLYSSVGKAKSLDISTGNPTISDAQQHAVDWLSRQAGFKTSTSGVNVGAPAVSPQYAFPLDEVTQRVNMMGRYTAALGPSCAGGNVVGAAAVQGAMQAALGLESSTARRTMGAIRSRKLLDATRGYRLSEVQIGAPGSPAFSALLARPLGEVASAPAVLAVNGEDDLGDLFDIGPPPLIPYLHGYAAALAKRGFVVMVPIIPDWVPDGFGAIAKAQRLDPWSVWKVLMPVYQQSLDALLREPGVDSLRVAVTGISFGGTAASLIAAWDLRIRGVVFNNIPVDYTKVFDTGAGGFSNIWLLDACSIANAALRAAAPRPFTWQAGEDPLAQNAGMDIIADVRNRYRALGVEERFTFQRHWGAHEMFPELFRIFGR